MMRRIWLVALLALTVVATSGCATKALLDHVAKEEYRDNVAAYATSAWREKDDELVVCATGWTAKRGLNGEPNPFSIRLTIEPADMPAGDAGFDEPAPQNSWDLYTHLVAEESIEGSCPDRPDGETDVPVERFAAEDPIDAAGSGSPFWGHLTPVDLDRAGPVLYSFDDSEEKKSAILVYQNETPMFEGSRLVRVDLPGETIHANSIAIVALPLTLAVDAVGIVLIVAFCMLSPPDC